MAFVLCSLFGHRRDSRRVIFSMHGWRAPCRFCEAKMARTSPRRWQILVEEEDWPCLAPYARPPRIPFLSESGVETGDPPDGYVEAGGDRRYDGAEREGHAGGRSRGSGGTRNYHADEHRRTRHLLHALFDQASPDEREAQGATDRPRRDRPTVTGGSEAEMFAVAFACCRDMLFRLSDQFSSEVSQARRGEGATIDQ